MLYARRALIRALDGGEAVFVPTRLRCEAEGALAATHHVHGVSARIAKKPGRFSFCGREQRSLSIGQAAGTVKKLRS